MRTLTALLLLLPLAALADVTLVAQSTDQKFTDTSVTPSEPTGAQEDDLIVAFCTHVDEGNGTWADPADFTQLDSIDAGTGVTVSLYIGYKVRGATSGSGYQFTYSGAASDDIRCTLAAFRDIDTTTPFDATYSRANHYADHTNGTTDANEAITVSTAGAMVYLVQWLRDGSMIFGAPSGYTLGESNDTFNSSHGTAYKSGLSAGTETPGAWTHSNVNLVDTANITLAIKPAPDDSTAIYRRRGR